MKTIFYLLAVLMSFVLYGQNTVVPLNTPFDDIPDNGYVKDTQNQLNPFAGIWVYQQGTKKVTIKLEKLIYYNDGAYPKYYIDVINGRYKVENGSTIVYSDWNEEMLYGDISGVMFRNGYYLMDYWDEKECRLSYDVKVKLDPNNSNRLIWEMSVTGIVSYDFEDECQRKYDSDWGTVSTLPRDMVLIRQP